MARINVIEATKVIRIGQRVEITLGGDEDEKSYASRVEDFDERKLVIGMPMDKGYPIIPAVNEKLYVHLRTADGVYKFDSVFLSKAAHPIPVLNIQMPQEMEKHQQREFVRVNVMLPLKVRLEDEQQNLLAPYHTKTLDISGGGIRFVMHCALREGSRVHIETNEIEGLGVLRLYCQVIRSVQSSGDNKIYWIGTKFLDLPKNIQRNLIRFIFKKQREFLAKRIPE